MDTRDQTATGGRRVICELAEWVAGIRVDVVPDTVLVRREAVR
jgi:hypothetical protein